MKLNLLICLFFLKISFCFAQTDIENCKNHCYGICKKINSESCSNCENNCNFSTVDDSCHCPCYTCIEDHFYFKK